MDDNATTTDPQGDALAEAAAKVDNAIKTAATILPSGGKADQLLQKADELAQLFTEAMTVADHGLNAAEALFRAMRAKLKSRAAALPPPPPG